MIPENHGLRKHPLYNVWCNMRRHCYEAKNSSYKYYGGRGITVCDEWRNSFKSFYDWAVTHGYGPELIFDRENVNDNYYPGNCRFITVPESEQNKQLLRSDNKTGLRWVFYRKERDAYTVSVQVDGKRKKIGYFKDPILGAVAYNNYVLAHKTLLPLNPIPPEYQHLIINPNE